MRLRSLALAAGLAGLVAACVPAAALAQLSDADVVVAQAILAYEEKRYDQAEALLREALTTDPEHVEALYYLGLVHIAQQKLSAAVEVLERARARAPDDFAVRVQLGVAYFALERYDRAEPLLTAAFRERPTTDGPGYYVGFLRYRKRDYEGALQAFQSGATSDPNIQQLVRFYSGLSLAALGRTEQATAEVNAALRTQVTSPLTGPAERLRDTLLAARRADQRFRAEVRVGATYDSNVPVLPEPSHDPTAEAARNHHRRDSTGELAAARFDYAWLRTGPWESTITYSFFQSYYNELPSFNIQNHLGGLSGSYTGRLSGLPYQLGAQYTYDYLTLGGNEFVQRHTATSYATLVEGPVHVTTLLMRFQNKEFSDDTNIHHAEIRDARNWLAGAIHVLRFASERHYVRMGYQFDVEDADGRDWRYRGHRMLVGGQFTLPWWGMRLKYDYDVHIRNYTERHVFLPERAPGTRQRADIEQTHVVRIEQPLPLSLTLAAEYQGSVARSNIPLYGFNRNVFSLILSWQY